MMKARIGYEIAFCVGTLIFVACAGMAAAQDVPDETALIGVLQGNAGWQEKDAACRALREKSTVAAVPALAALLIDKELSHAARYALEPMPFAEAGQALRNALGKTEGALKAGMAISLGVRRDVEAVPLLISLMKDANADVARAALGALGRIATVPAVDALMGCDAPEAVRPALAEALLTAGEHLAKAGEEEQAVKIYRLLQTKKWPVHVRMGAFRGLVYCEKGKMPELVIGAMKGKEPALRDMAAQIVAEAKGTDLTPVFVEGLQKLPSKGQVAMLRGLADRNDRVARPAVVKLITTSDAEVKLAVVKALATLGNGEDVAALAGLLASDDVEMAKAALGTLVALKGDDINPAIAAAFAGASSGIRARLLDLATERRAEEAVPLAAQSLADAELAVRIAALRTLTPLGTQAQVPALLEVLAKAKDDSERSSVAKALGGIASRAGEGLLPTLLDAMNGATVESRVVLLRVVARVGGAGALEAVRVALSSAEAPIAEESVRLLSEWPSLDAAPVLLELAKSADLGRQVLGLRGYVRLAGIEPSVETKSKMLVDAMALVKRPDEKKVVLGGWGAVATLQALDVLMPYLDDADVRNEAGVAITAVAGQLGKLAANKPRASEALQAVIDKCADSGIRERATKSLKSLP